jgi:uncharacterized membrane protein HdeD (DUF308 family)
LAQYTTSCFAGHERCSLLLSRQRDRQPLTDVEKVPIFAIGRQAVMEEDENGYCVPESIVPNEEAPEHGPWVILLGSVLIMLGFAGMAVTLATTLGSVGMMGFFLLLAGLLQILHTFSRHPHRNFTLDLLIAVFFVTVGILIVSHPTAGPLEIGLLLSAFMVVTGIFRVIVGTVDPVDSRISVIVSGMVSFGLGIILWLIWPATGFLMITLFIAAELVVTGWNLVMRGIMERRAAREGVPQTV